MSKGYRLRSDIKTSIMDSGSLEELHQDTLTELCRQHGLTEGRALLYRLNGPCWARISDGEMILPREEESDVEMLERARLFNETREILIWTEDDGRWYYRVRLDGEGEPVPVIDADQMLLGQARETRDGFTLLWESRGGAGRVPLTLEPDQRARLVTRNYIGFANHCQAGFCDTRFIDLQEGEYHG